MSQQKPTRRQTKSAARRWTEEPTRPAANGAVPIAKSRLNDAPTIKTNVGSAAPDGPRNPRTGRFMPGHVQNPNGRPRKARTVGATIAGALKEPIPVTENGRRRRISKLQAAAQQIANKSAAGDLRASKMAIDLAQRAEQQAAEQSPIDRLSASDEEIVERVKARFRRIIIEEMEQEDGHPDTTGV
jgi:Family of unknown function (DUF5681)